MNRSIAVLMISVSLFNLAANCFPQDIYPHDQAKVDAEADMSSDTWFLLGAMAPLGCLTGCAVGTAIDARFGSSDFFSYLLYLPSPSNAQGYGACIGGVVGLSMFPVASVLRPVIPAPERLLGKSPEYVSAYTAAYEQQIRSARLRSAAAGVAVGTAVSCLFGLSMWED